ncbi:MAG: acyltransferase [Rhodospirillum sp.]|nr:acyltransferase [Rhodospirillum sp.]MCF8487816.1 acyltransferase [Rhodospirillum sp.]MCF8499914.1 acyltransferase [Rhodospirillum sp.]
MGSIRTLLAISVLITHSDPIFGIQLMNGDMAITCFFMISGFLMGLILETKYKHLGPFYLNRVLRIYPAYLVALVFTAAVIGLMGSETHNPYRVWRWLWDVQDWPGMIYGAVANLTLVGIDLSRYAGILEDGPVVFPAFLHPLEDVKGGHNLLFVPQGWTLALELTFYLIAPFVTRLRTRLLAPLVLCVVVGARIGDMLLARLGYHIDVSALFPFQVQYFLFGVLAWRGYQGLHALPDRYAPAIRVAAWAMVLVALCLILFGYDLFHMLNNASQTLLYASFAATIPFLFHLSRRSNWDKWAGEFSYPIYLFHFGVVQFLGWYVGVNFLGEAALVMTLAICALYIFLVDRPLQAWRARIARQDAGRGAPTMVPESLVSEPLIGEPPPRREQAP